MFGHQSKRGWLAFHTTGLPDLWDSSGSQAVVLEISVGVGKV